MSENRIYLDQNPEERIMARPVPIASKFSGALIVYSSEASPDFHTEYDCVRLGGPEWETDLLVNALKAGKKDPCPECWPEEYFENETTLHTMEEPPLGSVVAIGWGEPRQEIWVSNSANIGNWYTTDVPLDWHPSWADVLYRARGRTLTLLVVADSDAYKTGYAAGIEAAKQAVENAIEDVR